MLTLDRWKLLLSLWNVVVKEKTFLYFNSQTELKSGKTLSNWMTKISNFQDSSSSSFFGVYLNLILYYKSVEFTSTDTSAQNCCVVLNNTFVWWKERDKLNLYVQIIAEAEKVLLANQSITDCREVKEIKSMRNFRWHIFKNCLLYVWSVSLELCACLFTNANVSS